MEAVRQHRTRNIGKYIPKVYSALPGPDEPGIDYECVRDRVHAGMKTIKSALKILVANHRAEVMYGGLRNRKVFRRAHAAEIVRGLTIDNVEGQNVLLKQGHAVKS